MTLPERLPGDERASRFSRRRSKVGVAFALEDTDFLARGMVKAIGATRAKVCLARFWSRRDKPYAIDWLDIAVIVQEPVAPSTPEADHPVMLNFIVPETCVVRTDLLRLVTDARAKPIQILAPAMMEGAGRRLAHR